MGIIDECFGVAEGILQRKFQFLSGISPIPELWLDNLVKHGSIYHQQSLKCVINIQVKFCKNKCKTSRKDWSERTFLKFCIHRPIAPKVFAPTFWYFQSLIFRHLCTTLWIGLLINRNLWIQWADKKFRFLSRKENVAEGKCPAIWKVQNNHEGVILEAVYVAQLNCNRWLYIQLMKKHNG